MYMFRVSQKQAYLETLCNVNINIYKMKNFTSGFVNREVNDENEDNNDDDGDTSQN